MDYLCRKTIMTNAEFVSRIINDMGAVVKDTHVSRRWILSIGRQKAQAYIAQKWDEGMLFGEEDLFTHINCLRMIKIRSIDCCFDEFKLCKTLMRSEKKIPGLVYARLSPAIISVSSVDEEIQFLNTTLRKYKNMSGRKFSFLESKNHYYYFKDGYIWIPDTEIEAINVSCITLKQKEALELAGCSKDDDKDKCKSEWEHDFISPIKLHEYIASETLNECFNRMKIRQDENPNMDSNLKTATIN